MATLTAWKFDSPDGAEEAERTLMHLQEQDLIHVHDAAYVTWPQGKKKPKTKQTNSLTGPGALDGAFWGMLFGLLFFVPLLGAAIGGAAGAIGGSMVDVGIDDDFILAVREKVTPGTSALFALTTDAVPDRVHEAFEGQRPELLATNLSKEDEDRLRETFGV